MSSVHNPPSQQDQATAVALAGLFARFDNLSSVVAELKGMLASQSAAISNFQIVQRDLQRLEEQNEKTLAAVEAQASLAVAHSTAIGKHAFIWKICGTLALLSTGLVGFGYSKIEAFQKYDVELERRVLVLEYQMQAVGAGRVDKGSKRDETN